MNMKRVAIITGATGGVGKEFVKQMMLEPIDEIWAIARNAEKLNALSKEFGNKIVPVSMDLSQIAELDRLEQKLKKESPIVRYLVNNAGLAKMASYQDFTKEEIDTTINLNCKAPIILCTVCIPYMEKGSHILNISSASAFQPNPYINLYAASKAFERSYSRALHVELMGTGITSTAVCPGWIDTELLSHKIKGKEVKFPGIVTAERVVKQAIKDTKKGKDMSICSMYVKCQHINVKLLPQKLVMKIWMRGIKDYI